MINRKTLVLQGMKIGLVIIMLLTGRALYDKLPEQTPRHRNFQGQVDGYGTRMGAVLGIPLLVLAMIIMFRFLPKLDPKKANYPKFTRAREIMQWSIIGFMAYIHFVSFRVILHPEQSINTFMFFGLGLMFTILGNYLGKIKHNFFIGIKTPRTIANETVRNKTHRLGGRLMVLTGITFLIQTFIQQYIAATFIIMIGAMVLIPMIYSYIIFKKETK